MIFQCTQCPKIKIGPPWRSSATKPMLCDNCARNSVANTTAKVSAIEDKKRLFRAIAEGKPARMAKR